MTSEVRTDLIDWDGAARTAARLAPAPPALSAAEIAEAVADIRIKAEASVNLVHQITGLSVADGLADSPILVVDRAGWSRANTQGFSAMLAPVMAQAPEKLTANMSAQSLKVSRSVTGAQTGAILAFLSSKVLGQYEPFSGRRPDADGLSHPGRLLLVAPNIIEIERQLGVDTDDFRLWVCVHEQTHRVQFAAAPWLADHMLGLIAQMGDSLFSNTSTLLARATEIIKSPGKGEERGSLSDVLTTPADKKIMSEVTGIMSLLEGHATVVMDAVDASVIPTIKTIRQRFNNRGKGKGPLEAFIRRVLGLDAKMRQYTDGARFVKDVVARVGMEGFNHVWLAPQNLPTEAEIHDPDMWVVRMGLAGAS